MLHTNQVFDKAINENGSEKTGNDYPLWLRGTAKFFSYLFHPLFLSLYVAAFLLYIHPYAFAGAGKLDKIKVLASVAVNTAMFPAVLVLLLKQLGFIESIQLKTQKDRIIPIIASMIFYFWAFYVSKNIPGISPMLTHFLLGTFLASILALMANIKLKISLHAIGVGGLLAFFIILSLTSYAPLGVFLSIVAAITGIVCTSRFIASDHTFAEVYAGLFGGALCMLVAYWFV